MLIFAVSKLRSNFVLFPPVGPRSLTSFKVHLFKFLWITLGNCRTHKFWFKIKQLILYEKTLFCVITIPFPCTAWMTYRFNEQQGNRVSTQLKYLLCIAETVVIEKCPWHPAHVYVSVVRGRIRVTEYSIEVVILSCKTIIGALSSCLWHKHSSSCSTAGSQVSSIADLMMF